MTQWSENSAYARSVGSPIRSSANSDAGPPSPSSDTSRSSTKWAETTSPEPHGAAINAVLAGAGYNFRLLILWLRLLLAKILAAIISHAPKYGAPSDDWHMKPGKPSLIYLRQRRMVDWPPRHHLLPKACGPTGSGSIVT